MQLFGVGPETLEVERSDEPFSSTNARVVSVIDGDTIDVAIAGAEKRIRYIGIDTPEQYSCGEPECFSREATARNRELVLGKEVRLESGKEDKDTYGRLLRYVYVEDMFVNQVLVAEGYATTLTIPPNTREYKKFRDAEQSARENGLGIWSACNSS